MPISGQPVGVVVTQFNEDTPHVVSTAELLLGLSYAEMPTFSNFFVSNGTVTANADGSYTIVPAPDYNGALTLAYDVTDNLGNTVSWAQYYDVLAVNDAPTGAATAVLAAGLVNQPYTVTAAELLAGFSDADGDTLAVSGLTVSGGNVLWNPDGSYTVIPPLDYAGPINLAYEVIDGNGGSLAVVQTITLLANDLQAGDDALLVTRGMASSLDAAVLLANDSANPAAALSVTAVSNAVGGSVELIDGKLVITASDAVGSFDYVVTADTGVSTTGHVDFSSVLTTNKANLITAGAVAAADLQGQGGNDRLTGAGGADRLVGNGGDDRLFGLAGDDLLNGGLGSDYLVGGAGDDSYVVERDTDLVVEKVGEGIDTVFSLVSESLSANVDNLRLLGSNNINGAGNELANVITGNAAANVLGGGAGNDVLAGGGGRDVLNGGFGDDVLIGGGGDDQLNGGWGADVFRFESLADFEAGTRVVESIGDFRRGQGDNIDLASIDANSAVAGDQAFDFIGSAGFGHIAGELRYAVSKAGAVVSGDVDGDGAADFSFLVSGVSSLASIDFAV